MTVDVGQEEPTGGWSTTLASRYMLRGTIASGAAATVWRADDRRTGEAVAVKVLHHDAAAQADVVAAFREEGRVLAELDHPGVVRPREFVADDGQLALVMDLVPGTDLRRKLVADGPLRPADAAAVLTQVCAALAAVHAAGIVHGDVKPSNILVPADGLDDGVRLADFGVAQRMQRPTGATHATPEYVAPEIVDGVPPTPASDMYGVGIVLYETLAARSPYRGGPVDEVLRRHARYLPVRPSGMPDPLWDMIVRCLELNPRRRPAAAELAAELRALRPALTGLPPAVVDATRAAYEPRTVAALPGALTTTVPVEEPPVPNKKDKDYVTLDDMFGSDSGSLPAWPPEPAPAGTGRPDAAASWAAPGHGEEPTVSTPASPDDASRHGAPVSAPPGTAAPVSGASVRDASVSGSASSGTPVAGVLGAPGSGTGGVAGTGDPASAWAAASTAGPAGGYPAVGDDAAAFPTAPPEWAASTGGDSGGGRRPLVLVGGIAAGVVLLVALVLGGWLAFGRGGADPRPSAPVADHHGTPGHQSSASPDRHGSPSASASPSGSPGTPPAAQDPASQDPGTGDPGTDDPGNGEPSNGDPGGIGQPMPSLP